VKLVRKFTPSQLEALEILLAREETTGARADEHPEAGGFLSVSNLPGSACIAAGSARRLEELELVEHYSTRPRGLTFDRVRLTDEGRAVARLRREARP
jgi:hypothetical protein